MNATVAAREYGSDLAVLGRGLRVLPPEESEDSLRGGIFELSLAM